MSQPGSVGAAADRGADPEDLVEFLSGQWPIAHGHGAQHFPIEFDLVERNAVGDAKIEMLAHRAHLHRQAD